MQKRTGKIIAISILTILSLNITVIIVSAATYASPNFYVETEGSIDAKQFADALENNRKSIAIELTGQTFLNWNKRMMVKVKVISSEKRGGMSYLDLWKMNVNGSVSDIMNTVIPHEVSHTIMFTYFGVSRPTPRWADEGIATTFETCDEKENYKKMLIKFLQTGKGIAFNQLFAMTNYYPKDIMPLFAEGYSLAEFLSLQGGRKKFVTGFLNDIVKNGMNWNAAVKKHYGYADLTELQNTWLAWVRQGSPQTGIAGCKDPNVNENIQLKALKTVPSSYAAN